MSGTMEGSTRKPNPEDDVQGPEGHIDRAEARTELRPRPTRHVEPVQKAMKREKTGIHRDTKEREETGERDTV